jgi:hypothetical protein
MEEMEDGKRCDDLIEMGREEKRRDEKRWDEIRRG